MAPREGSMFSSDPMAKLHLVMINYPAGYHDKGHCWICDHVVGSHNKNERRIDGT